MVSHKNVSMSENHFSIKTAVQGRTDRPRSPRGAGGLGALGASSLLGPRNWLQEARGGPWVLEAPRVGLKFLNKNWRGVFNNHRRPFCLIYRGPLSKFIDIINILYNTIGAYHCIYQRDLIFSRQYIVKIELEKYMKKNFRKIEDQENGISRHESPCSGPGLWAKAPETLGPRDPRRFEAPDKGVSRGLKHSSGAEVLGPFSSCRYLLQCYLRRICYFFSIY